MAFTDKAKRVANLSSRIAKLQRLLIARPDDEKLMIALSSLAKRAEMARAALEESMGHDSIDLIDYRVHQIDEKYPVKSISESLGTFQSSVTSIYDAVVNGPKNRARYSSDVIEETALTFESFYPGSKGFILSVPTGKDLFEGNLERTADALSDYLEVASTDSARDAARSLGLAAISTLFRWVQTNAQWENSIDYRWSEGVRKSTGRHIPSERFQLLEEVFRGAEENEQSVVKKSGVLVGLDVAQRKFHFSVPDGESYRGKLHSDYPSGERTVPSRYVAIMIRNLKRVPATGEEKETFELAGLESVS